MLTLPDPATGLPTGVGATAITIAPLGWVFPAPGVTCGSLGATFGSNCGNLLSQTRTITVPVGATYTSATALAKRDGTLHDGAADPTFSILIPISSTTGCVLIGDCPDTRTPIPPGVTLSTPTRGTVTSGVPTVYWHDPMTITVPGCPGGTGTATLVYSDGTSQTVGLTAILPAGTFEAIFAAAYPEHGTASISWTITCPDSSVITNHFNVYIDPSGVVRDTFGYPVVGATVTLSCSVNSGGPFAVVPAGSAIMSPGNRANPDLTIAGGTFGWDVIAGFYRVRAEKSGCTAPGGGAPFVETGVLPIPPPVIDLALTLYCPVTPADLLALIGSLGLERGLASDLTNKTQDAARRMATGKDPCKPLDELVRRVMDEVGKERPKLTTAQARALLHDTYAVEFTDGCRPIGSMLPAAETAVVDLIDVINGLGLPRELATDLRAKASDAGKAAATGVGDPCRKLDEILRTAGRQLTAAQIPAITAAVGEVRVAIGC